MRSVTRDLDDLQHDLRTHLTVMTGFADLLARPGELDQAARRDYAQRILTAVMEIRDIVDELEE
jgi:signal transduction histidine kinase